MHDSSRPYSPEARDVYLTVPNLISLLRIASIPCIAVLIARHQMLAALVVLALSSLTDGLDGFIARTFNQVSKLGQILDPIADRLLIVSSVLALSIAGIIPWWVLPTVMIRDAVLLVLIVLLAQYDYGPLPIHFVGKTGTALLMMTTVSLMVADTLQGSFAHVLNLAALACGIWGIGLYWLAGYIYIAQGVRLLTSMRTAQS